MIGFLKYFPEICIAGIFITIVIKTIVMVGRIFFKNYIPISFR